MRLGIIFMEILNPKHPKHISFSGICFLDGYDHFLIDLQLGYTKTLTFSASFPVKTIKAFPQTHILLDVC